MVFLEDASFSTNQFVLKTGTIAGQPASLDPDSLVLQGNVNANPVVNLFVTPFTQDTWHNFGVVLDFDQKWVLSFPIPFPFPFLHRRKNVNGGWYSTTQILYSTDSSPLAEVKAPTANDISGQGQYHFGALKKPTGDNLTDITKQGFQESGINEGIIYAGIFMEDSQSGCVSLSPSSNATSAPVQRSTLR